MILLKNVIAMPSDQQHSACHKMLLSVSLSELEVDHYKNNYSCMMNSDCSVQMEPQSVRSSQGHENCHQTFVAQNPSHHLLAQNPICKEWVALALTLVYAD